MVHPVEPTTQRGPRPVTWEAAPPQSPHLSGRGLRSGRFRGCRRVRRMSWALRIEPCAAPPGGCARPRLRWGRPGVLLRSQTSVWSLTCGACLFSVSLISFCFSSPSVFFGFDLLVFLLPKTDAQVLDCSLSVFLITALETPNFPLDRA